MAQEMRRFFKSRQLLVGYFELHVDTYDSVKEVLANKKLCVLNSLSFES